MRKKSRKNVAWYWKKRALARAGERLRQQTLPKILHGSKYADRLPIGKEETIKNFKHEALKRFYADWYRPDLMAVVIVGDVDPKKAQALVENILQV